jgi:hypothetical protein
MRSSGQARWDRTLQAIVNDFGCEEWGSLWRVPEFKVTECALGFNRTHWSLNRPGVEAGRATRNLSYGSK